MALRTVRHTFRDTTVRTWLKLEPEIDAFRRYKQIRREKRDYFKDTPTMGSFNAARQAAAAL